MKTLTVTLTLFIFSGVASAQNPDPSKWMCRNLSESGNFLYQGETIFGSQACRPIPQTVPAAPAAAPAPREDARDNHACCLYWEFNNNTNGSDICSATLT
jgi:hypothetical protein